MKLFLPVLALGLNAFSASGFQPVHSCLGSRTLHSSILPMKKDSKSSSSSSSSSAPIKTDVVVKNLNNPLVPRHTILKKSLTNACGIALGLITAPLLIRNSSDMAVADDSIVTGRLIEFTVENVGGEVGQSGKVVIRTNPDWAPNGVERFEKLTEIGFWDECRIFRVLPGFITQFGINGDPTKQALWRSSIRDDKVAVTNKRGTVTFATAGPNTRTTQIFINTGNNTFLDRQGFSPIGEVIEGMDIVDKFYSGYGEGAPQGKGPNQGLIQSKGNEYLTKAYPKLSYFSKVKFI